MNNLNESFELKASTITANILEILNPDFDRFNHDLKAKIAEAPEFFYKMPLLISCKKIAFAKNEDLELVLKLCRTHKVKIMGVSCANKEQEQIVAKTKYPVLHSNVAHEHLIKFKNQEPSNSNLVINHLVRNGTKLVAENGDLIVLNSVNAGAELHAANNIHVYGVLRGRAFAGINGNKNASVFCHNLQAEMIAINGVIETAENLSTLNAWQKSAHISLENDQFKIVSF